MNLMNEYINRKLSGPQLEEELLKLIDSYNKLRGVYLFVYSAAISKQLPQLALDQGDFYLIHDLLKSRTSNKKLDFYIETPGGSGEAAEEIGNFLHNNFETVSFVVSGEAKSAGTILALSGDDILMTETGSLGPIDAQMKIGRSLISAYDYVEWVEEKRTEAQKEGRLNPVDATMVAQISPGELLSVFHALKFAEDLVKKWLPKYKFKNWTVTETNKKPVTADMKQKRAEEIARDLTNHSKWRSHGRSIKIEDLRDIGLKVIDVDQDKELAGIVYRIQAVCRMLFETTAAFKIFATKDNKIFRHVVPSGIPMPVPQAQMPAVVQIDQKCPKCGEVHRFYVKLIDNPQIDADMKQQGIKQFPKDGVLKCNCGQQLDLNGIKAQIEGQAGRKIII